MISPESIVYPTDAERKARALRLWHEWHGEDAHHCAGKPKWSGYGEGWCGQQVKAEGDFCYAHRSQAVVIELDPSAPHREQGAPQEP